MFLSEAYCSFKILVPARRRTCLRGYHVLWKLVSHMNIRPIEPNAAKAPGRWGQGPILTENVITPPIFRRLDGMGTIFAFWVSDQDHQKGYVGLLYTIPQVFLLFVIMQQNNSAIWKKKLDWIAASLALPNVGILYKTISGPISLNIL
jgi:hypothetical protein